MTAMRPLESRGITYTEPVEVAVLGYTGIGSPPPPTALLVTCELCGATVRADVAGDNVDRRAQHATYHSLLDLALDRASRSSVGT